MTLALERSLFRLYYDYKTEEDKSLFLSSVFWLICLNSFLVIFLTAFLGGYITQYLGNVDLWQILMPVVLYTFLSAIINYTQILLQVEQNGRKFFIISVLILVSYNLIALILIFNYSGTVKSLVYASFLTYLLVFPYAFSLIRKRIRFVIDKKCVCAVFAYSSPMLLCVIISWVLNFSDRLFIANMSSYENAGIYSLAAKIVSIISLFAGAIFQAYGPYFYKIANTVPEADAKSRLKIANSIITFAILLLCISIIIASKTVLVLFFSEEFAGALIYIYILAISMMLTQQSGMLNIMIYQNKKTLSISLIAIICGILSVAMNIVLIPLIGAIGAAISNLTVGILLIGLTYLLARRNYYISINFPLVFFGMVYAICSMICDYYIGDHWMSLATKIVLLMAWAIVGLKVNLISPDAFVIFKNVIYERIHKVKE